MGNEKEEETEEEKKKKLDQCPPPIDDALMMVVATPITLGHKMRVPVLKLLWAYLGMEGAFTLIVLWGGSDLSYNDAIPEWIYGVAVYVTFGLIVKWFYIIYGEYGKGFEFENKKGTKDKVNELVKDVTNLPGLLRKGNFNEAMEVIAFKNGNLEQAGKLKYKYDTPKKDPNGKDKIDPNGKIKMETVTLSVFSIAIKTENEKIYNKIWDLMGQHDPQHR